MTDTAAWFRAVTKASRLSMKTSKRQPSWSHCSHMPSCSNYKVPNTRNQRGDGLLWTIISGDMSPRWLGRYGGWWGSIHHGGTLWRGMLYLRGSGIRRLRPDPGANITSKLYLQWSISAIQATVSMVPLQLRRYHQLGTRCVQTHQPVGIFYILYSNHNIS